MPKVAPEIALDPNQLTDTTSLPSTQKLPPRILPKHLADFKQYVDSKWCYYAEPLTEAEMVDIQRKVAYQCHMKVLMEGRHISWKETSHQWGNETFLGSTTLGRLVESTTRHGEGMGDMWSDYHFNLPLHDKKSREKRVLPEGRYLTRCSNCRGKCYTTCTHYECRGSGLINSKTEHCPDCKGTGKIRCSSCNALGGILHTPTLNVKWHTRKSTWYTQNSYLPKKKIRKGGRTPFWSATIAPWLENSDIQSVVQPIIENSPDIDLRTDIINHYTEKHLKPTIRKSIRMRRWACSIERMDFEEIQYSLSENYTNKRDSTRGNTFRFCQYPGLKGQQLIYENDYPLNCCGCFGEKLACYSCCCNIL